MSSSRPIFTAQQVLRVLYTNYRKETAVRQIIPQNMEWGQTKHHPKPQWLLNCWDVDKNAPRVYAVNDIKQFNPPKPPLGSSSTDMFLL